MRALLEPRVLTPETGRRSETGIGLLKLSPRLELPEAPVQTSSQFLAKLSLILNGKKIRLLSAWGKI